MDKFFVRRWWLLLAVLLAVAVWFQFLRSPATDQAFQKANGRIEATEIAIASKISGRIDEILVNEGDFVEAGQLLARINPDALMADLDKAKAQQLQSKTQVANAESAVAQRRSERAALEAALRQRQAELSAAEKREKRTDSLASSGAVSQQLAEDNQTAVTTAAAVVASAQAQLEANQAAIAAAETQVEAAKANLIASEAAIARIQVDLKETELKAPKAGRIQYRVLQPGEIVGAGGRVLNLIDLTDVFMTFFLPTQYAGQLTLKSEARIVVDALPDRAIPAKITFIADVAQFTPKTVETQNEREKLMFRIKAQVSPELLQKHIDKVKTGLPGVVWVRLDEQASWPEQLPALVQP
ncbi:MULTISPECIES: HlyD family secretion protein [Rheinheimera]|uniref:HlyD family secretion protein n=1 Tax=Rheinheimera marina TaxID=1774958 RepID=A0ABV9JPN3_9GAMM